VPAPGIYSMEKKPNKADLAVDEFDERGIYCRMLGHDLTFNYCRRTGDGSFCRRIIDCWHDKIEIGRYLKTFFTADEIAAVLHPSEPKLQTLLNLIDKTENRE